MAPIIRAFRDDEDFELTVVIVAQQTELLDATLADEGVVADHRIDVDDRSHPSAVLASSVDVLRATIEHEAPDVVLVHGDTTTALAGALAAFYAGVPTAHVEAGLRTLDPGRPFPEEMHRRLVDRLAWRAYAPTEEARANLIAEGVTDDAIAVVGNSVVDALRVALPVAGDPTEAESPFRTLLVTAHRRENASAAIDHLATALRVVLAQHHDVAVTYVLHPNPATRPAAVGALGRLERVTLLEPQPHAVFLRLLAAAAVVVTDSGGVQEEASVLGRPVVVVRDETERPEIVDGRRAVVAGTAVAALVAAMGRALALPPTARPPVGDGPLGDGSTADRIRVDLARKLA